MEMKEKPSSTISPGVGSWILIEHDISSVDDPIVDEKDPVIYYLYDNMPKSGQIFILRLTVFICIHINLYIELYTLALNVTFNTYYFL